VIAAIQRRLAARSDEDRQGGFTLIELMVVVMIIAILVGIAIPAFLGARRRAQDTAAKSNLRNALGTAQTIFTDNQAYLPVADTVGPPLVLGMVNTLKGEEPSFIFQNATTKSTTAKMISLDTLPSSGVATDPLDEIILSSWSGSGTCFYYRHVATAGLASSGTFWNTTGSGTDCQAGNAPAAGWKAL
jgi:prepilin-type N-terminal cleavage/methylation domain-containing protein